MAATATADVWKRDHFAWEYKSKHKNLKKAYQQLALYREALENPPGLVVCDMDRFEVHTNFTSTATEVHQFDLQELQSTPERPLRILRALMREPDKLKPTKTRAQITEEAASQFAELAERLRKRKHDPMDVARFLNRIVADSQISDRSNDRDVRGGRGAPSLTRSVNLSQAALGAIHPLHRGGPFLGRRGTS